MSSDISDLHMNYFLTTVQYQIFFFFCISRSMKFSHLEVSFVLLCCIYVMKRNGPWLRLRHSLLSQKPKGYILSIGKNTKQKNPKRVLQMSASVMLPAEGRMKCLLPFPFWSQPCFWQPSVVIFIIRVVKSLKTVSSERCFINSGALQ